MLIQPTSYRMTVEDAILCLILAYRIHGTETGVIAAAYRARDLVRIECRPTFTRIIRCGAVLVWVENYLKVIEV
ncbi:hypothetical protein [Pseudomonas sp. NA-150]|uniref:hypothetical protein n=1 Tax=Pseudomonas sp. NA-150 TaxID=3367525 RepID=UPI0037C80A32